METPVNGQASKSGPVRRRRAVAVVSSIAVHLLILFALLASHRDSPKPPELGPMTASLVDGFRLTNPEAAVAQADPAPAKSPPTFVRKALVSRAADTLQADDDPSPAPAPVLSEAQLAGAATADSGAAGGGDPGPKGGACNMARLLQDKLRRDAMVQAAVTASGPTSRAMMVWNGDWVRSSGQDGKGLAALLEAILWEVGFAPAKCRAEPVHGLVMISLNDAPGAARIVVGSDDWRWSDLLMLRP